MKIGINARTFSVDEPGGAVQAAIRHAEGLIDHPDSEVLLFGHQSINSMFPDTPVESSLYINQSQVYGLFWERTVLPRLVDSHSLDVLYCPNGNAPMSSLSCPIVTCIHDVNALDGWSSGIHQAYRKISIPRSVRVSETIATVSEFSKHEIAESLDAPLQEIQVVYNGVNPLFLSDQSSDYLDLPDRYLLFVGSLNPRKNIQRVIQAFIQLKQRFDIEHELVLIGPDNKTIFKNVDIEERDDIRTLGFVSEKKLKYAYTEADVFLFPSLYEGFGLPPLEALACGTPVVASNTTALGEILDDGCLLVNPENTDDIVSSVYRILSNEDLASRLSIEGEKYAREFSWDSSTDQLYVALSKAVEKTS